LVEKTDRLLRNITDYSKIDDLIMAFNVNIHLVRENAQLNRESKSNDKLMFGFKALMAKGFTDNLSEEVRKGMLEKAEQGFYPSIAPYGYINVKKNGRKVLKVNYDEAVYIKKMFELYATGAYSLLSLKKKDDCRRNGV